MKLRFSIRYKILSMVTALLVAAIVLYLMLATMIFRQDKMELVFDLNKSVVSTLATEVDTTLHGVTDKLRLYTLFLEREVVQKTRAYLEKLLQATLFLCTLNSLNKMP